MKRAALLVLAACSSGGNAPPYETTYPADCAGLGATDTAACAEARYWDAQLDHKEMRGPAYDLLTSLIRANPTMARLYFLRGTLAMTLALEDARGDLVTAIRPDLAKAQALDPSDARYPPWTDSMSLVLTFLANDTAAFAEAQQTAIEHVALDPTANILTLAGTMSGFPMRTGLPTKAVELLDAWSCDAANRAWCAHDTARAPFSQPGLAYMFGDAYARVGDRAHAKEWFDRALMAEGADAWPYRDIAERAARDVDSILAKYSALGADGSAMSLVAGNTTYGCSMCHTARP